MDAVAIDVRGLHKRFPRTAGFRDILTFWRRQYTVALDGVDLQVPEGSIHGVLGPNGAGKTTLLKVLAGLVLPDRGSVRVNGVDTGRHPEQAGRHLTYVSGEERSLYWRLTGRQNLQFFAVLLDVPRGRRRARVDEVLAAVGLADVADNRVVEYSTGMRQRLAIARGLLSEPGILLLDEPTRSLDPATARKLTAFIREDLVGRQGRTVVLATHNMQEAAYLCDLVAVLHRGRVVASGPVAALAARLSAAGQYSITVADVPYDCLLGLKALPGVSALRLPERDGLRPISFQVTVREPSVDIPVVVDWLVRAGGRVAQVSQVTVPLADVIAALAEEGQQ